MTKGLAALGEELRAIEADDTGGEKFSRFKNSDDATALAVAAGLSSYARVLSVLEAASEQTG